MPIVAAQGQITAPFVVRDHNGQQLASVYFEDEPRAISSGKLLTPLTNGNRMGKRAFGISRKYRDVRHESEMRSTTVHVLS
jgi:hypothetical protein